jgi:hypothetical protein
VVYKGAKEEIGEWRFLVGEWGMGGWEAKEGRGKGDGAKGDMAMEDKGTK